MQKDSQQISDNGIQVVAVSYDSVEILKGFSDKSEIKFPLLSDADSSVIKLYGLLNEKAKGKQAGIPHPATILVDKTNKIVARLDGTVMKRHTTKALLESIPGKSNDNKKTADK